MNTSPFRAGDKVVAYCRYSEGDEQGLKNTSTKEQADAIREYCEAHQLQLVQVFEDPFASGRSVQGRDHYLEMLSFLLKKHKPDIQGVILWDYERYGRNMDRAQLDAARLRMAGYKLFSMQQPIVDEGPFARVLESMYFASAQNQSDMISADVKRALQNNFQKYKVIPRSSIGWGWIPYPVDMGVFSDGSSRIGYRAVPDPAKVDVICEAVSARLAGASYTKCREILGMKDNYAVIRLFDKPLLYGEMSYGDTTIEDYCDPIISRDVFDALRAFENTHRQRQVGRQGGWSSDPPMLSGLLYCAHCGVPMYINRRVSKGHLYCTYRCKNCCCAGVRQEKLEPFIIEMCDNILTRENILKWISDLSLQNTDEVAVRRLAEKELSDVMRKIENLTELIADHPSEALMFKLTDLETKRDALRNVANKDENTESKSIDTDTLYKNTLKLSETILRILHSPETSAETKKTALQTFVRSIVWGHDGQVVINYLPPAFPVEVVTQSPHNLTAPPEGLYSRSQRM